jgi:hypothetical protein
MKHSPYVGALKGDAWVSARTEVGDSGRKISGGTTTYTRTYTNSNGETTTTTNVVNNGHSKDVSEFRPRSGTFTREKPSVITAETTRNFSQAVA